MISLKLGNVDTNNSLFGEKTYRSEKEKKPFRGKNKSKIKGRGIQRSMPIILCDHDEEGM